MSLVEKIRRSASIVKSASIASLVQQTRMSDSRRKEFIEHLRARHSHLFGLVQLILPVVATDFGTRQRMNMTWYTRHVGHTIGVHGQHVSKMWIANIHGPSQEEQARWLTTWTGFMVNSCFESGGVGSTREERRKFRKARRGYCKRVARSKKRTFAEIWMGLKMTRAAQPRQRRFLPARPDMLVAVKRKFLKFLYKSLKEMKITHPQYQILK